MEKRIQLIDVAIQDYKELRSIVDTSINDVKTAQVLYQELKGHNWDFELFDVNYKSITATIIFDPKTYCIVRLSEDVEIWEDNENGTVFLGSHDMNQLLSRKQI